MAVPKIYAKIKSHFKNKYPNTGYSNMSQGLSDALDVACAIMGVRPSQFGLYQGAYNTAGPINSKGYHGKANAFDFDIPTSSKVANEWIKVFSYIGVAGWIRDASPTRGRMLPRHFHGFCLFQANKSYVDSGIIGQQRDYLNGGDGLDNGGGRDYHSSLRPTLKAVHFMGKAPSRTAVVTVDTHSYKEPGKLKTAQDKTRKKGYKITNAVGVVRVWKLDAKGNTIPYSDVDMLVTEGLRFYDLAKVRWT